MVMVVEGMALEGFQVASLVLRPFSWSLFRQRGANVLSGIVRT